MPLWDFIETKFLPLFGDITPYAHERVRDTFWIVLGVITVHFLLYLPYKALLALMRKCKWKGKWLL